MVEDSFACCQMSYPLFNQELLAPVFIGLYG